MRRVTVTHTVTSPAATQMVSLNSGKRQGGMYMSESLQAEETFLISIPGSVRGRGAYVQNQADALAAIPLWAAGAQAALIVSQWGRGGEWK